MSADTCTTCGTELGPPGEFALPGIPVDRHCDACTRKRRIAMMLDCLPEEEDANWRSLSRWEQDFLPSVREQWSERGTLTDKQVEALEKIWRKM